MSVKQQVREPSAFYEVLSQCSASDFDGHSMFNTFTTRQRLEWLDEVRSTMLALKKISNPAER